MLFATISVECWASHGSHVVDHLATYWFVGKFYSKHPNIEIDRSLESMWKGFTHQTQINPHLHTEVMVKPRGLPDSTWAEFSRIKPHKKGLP